MNLYNPFRNDILSKELIEKSINFLFLEFYDPPTKINFEGTKFWKNSKGEFHRDNDLPAVIYKNGSKYWYQNGKRHRLNGPAVIYENGSKYWYQNGKYHRENGPAVIYKSGNKYWFVDGSQYSEESWKREIAKRRSQAT